MTNEARVDITNAVYDAYVNTTGQSDDWGWTSIVRLSVPSDFGNREKVIAITRHKDKEKNELVYQLHTKVDDKIPFMTVFGCWPIGFVADIFIKTLEHYFEWY